MVLPDDFLRRHGFRLPTEHEWEYVARAGSSTSRFFGNAESDLDKYAWFARNSGSEGGHTWPVGRLRPNPLGLFDIYGNVHEWCEIWPPAANPERGPIRGGGYRSSSKFLRSAMPERDSRTAKPYSYLGFRIAMTLESP
jgi:formylglycine-generating enzyme required for sulfatase activity